MEIQTVSNIISLKVSHKNKGQSNNKMKYQMYHLRSWEYLAMKWDHLQIHKIGQVWKNMSFLYQSWLLLHLRSMRRWFAPIFLWRIMWNTLCFKISANRIYYIPYFKTIIELKSLTHIHMDQLLSTLVSHSILDFEIQLSLWCWKNKLLRVVLLEDPSMTLQFLILLRLEFPKT